MIKINQKESKGTKMTQASLNMDQMSTKNGPNIDKNGRTRLNKVTIISIRVDEHLLNRQKENKLKCA